MGFTFLRAACQLTRRSGGLAVLLAGLVSGCGADSRSTTPADVPSTSGRTASLDRSLAIQSAVQRWADAATLPAAKAAAEHARNLVTGPHVQGAGDANADGALERVRVGLLPGEDGSPGLASPLAGECVQRDVLGGSWADPMARWAEVTRRIDHWAPDSNTFPALPSHAQRVVGWASLTLQTDRLADAHEFSGHAAGHAGVVVDALRSPDANPCPDA